MLIRKLVNSSVKHDEL